MTFHAPVTKPAAEPSADQPEIPSTDDFAAMNVPAVDANAVARSALDRAVAAMSAESNHEPEREKEGHVLWPGEFRRAANLKERARAPYQSSRGMHRVPSGVMPLPPSGGRVALPHLNGILTLLQ